MSSIKRERDQQGKKALVWICVEERQRTKKKNKKIWMELIKNPRAISQDFLLSRSLDHFFCMYGCIKKL